MARRKRTDGDDDEEVVEAPIVTASMAQTHLHEAIRYLSGVDRLQHHVSAVANVIQNIDSHQVANAKQLNMTDLFHRL